MIGYNLEVKGRKLQVTGHWNSTRLDFPFTNPVIQLNPVIRLNLVIQLNLHTRACGLVLHIHKVHCRKKNFFSSQLVERGKSLNLLLAFVTEVEQIRERFAKLLLGEDMSGRGTGVSSALALSNAITNLAGIFMVVEVVSIEKKQWFPSDKKF